jgi:hypothetical protein
MKRLNGGERYNVTKLPLFLEQALVYNHQTKQAGYLPHMKTLTCPDVIQAYRGCYHVYCVVIQIHKTQTEQFH